MFAAFERLFEQINLDMQIRAVVLTGAGTAFCSGGNVAEMRDKLGMFGGDPAQVAANYRAGIQRIPRAFQKTSSACDCSCQWPCHWRRQRFGMHV